MRHLIRQETSDIVNQKLLQKYEQTSAEIAILKHQLAQAQENIRIQKKRAPQGKPLFGEICAEGEQNTIFVSPSKIEYAFELQRQKEEAEQAKQARKQQLAIDRALNKAQKEEVLKQRKEECEIKRLEKAKQEAEKKAAKRAAKAQKEASKQLLLEAKSQKKMPTNKKQQASQPETSILMFEGIVESEVVISTQTRSGRNIRVPRYLQD